MKLIDASNLKIGRLASYVAKMALEGEDIAIINAEHSVVTGTKPDIVANYSQKRKVGSRYKGPFFPKRADRILKRTIRGMLPYKKQSGRDALNRIKVYLGEPSEFEGQEAETLEDAKIGRIERQKYLELGKLSEHIGG